MYHPLIPVLVTYDFPFSKKSSLKESGNKHYSKKYNSRKKLLTLLKDVSNHLFQLMPLIFILHLSRK